MGALDVELPADDREARAFMRAALRDVEALEALAVEGALEAGVRRTGLEQELCLVGPDARPRPCGPEVLARLDDSRFTTELARFSLEANFPPRLLAAGVFDAMEADLRQAMRTVSAAAAGLDARVLLTGILPTLRAGDLGRDSLTPERRYLQLNEAILRAHGPITVVIDGIESFEGTYDTVALEGVNTSLQLHLQVDPGQSGALYNLAQLVSAPLLAAATNSPVLLGHRLWHETRVAVFERSLDARSGAQRDRGSLSRVTFGDGWVGPSLVELFHDNLARFPVLLTRRLQDDALEQVGRGEVPALDALTLHNGTVWRWNRPCYGVLDGRPHLRIECRVLPAGPTVIDEVANAGLFYGLMLGLADDAGSIPARLAFDDARQNFLAAARHGLDAEFTWLDGRTVGARALLEELLPVARRGLTAAGIPVAEIDRYLGTAAARVAAGRTGSQWLLDVHQAQRGRASEEIWRGAVAAMLTRQFEDTPVHAWPDVPRDAPARPAEPTVGQIMTRKVFAVRPDDVLDLATRVMEWKHIRHVPVESEDGHLQGLVTARDLMRVRDRLGDDGADPVAVAEVMRTDLVTVRPSMPLREAMQVITGADGGCLLVVDEGRLLGIVTDRDLVVAASRLLSDPPGA